MKEREPGFDLSILDFVRIGLAAAFSLGGFYLIFRTMFGPPFFGPDLQAQLNKALQHPPSHSGQFQPSQSQIPPPQAAPANRTPGEVNAYIDSGKK